jgi:hypothetical protein
MKTRSPRRVPTISYHRWLTACPLPRLVRRAHRLRPCASRRNDTPSQVRPTAALDLVEYNKDEARHHLQDVRRTFCD